MPVKFKTGDMFESEAQAICNAVNCVGVMGAGLAAAFARRYPDMNEDYKRACEAKTLVPGGIHVYSLDLDQYIFNVATKDHWMQDSQYQWIVDGLKNIATQAEKLGITSVAVPGSGCGLGAFALRRVKTTVERGARGNWGRVKKIVEEVAAEHWQNLDVEVYEPQ